MSISPPIYPRACEELKTQVDILNSRGGLDGMKEGKSREEEMEHLCLSLTSINGSDPHPRHCDPPCPGTDHAGCRCKRQGVTLPKTVRTTAAGQLPRDAQTAVALVAAGIQLWGAGTMAPSLYGTCRLSASSRTSSSNQHHVPRLSGRRVNRQTEPYQGHTPVF